MVILLALISICIAVSAFAQTGKSQKQMTEDDLEYSTELNNLGMRFLNGNDVDQDYAEAVKWFRKAAGYGNSAAQYNLAYCYEKGWV